LSRPPAFEIPATPDADLFDERQLERPINPAPATPAGRTHIPIRMVVERNEHERFGKPANPKATQVMKVAGTVNEKRTETRADVAKEFFDQARRRREAQARPPVARIDHWQVARKIGPGIVEIQVQSSKSLCAQFVARKRS